MWEAQNELRLTWLLVLRNNFWYWVLNKSSSPLISLPLFYLRLSRSESFLIWPDKENCFENVKKYIIHLFSTFNDARTLPPPPTAAGVRHESRSASLALSASTSRALTPNFTSARQCLVLWHLPALLGWGQPWPQSESGWNQAQHESRGRTLTLPASLQQIFKR